MGRRRRPAGVGTESSVSLRPDVGRITYGSGVCVGIASSTSGWPVAARPQPPQASYKYSTLDHLLPRVLRRYPGDPNLLNRFHQVFVGVRGRSSRGGEVVAVKS